MIQSTRTSLWSYALFGLAALGSAHVSAAPTTVIAQHSNKCLDVRGGPQEIDDGAPIEQWTCTGASNQSWTLNDRGGEQYELVASNSNKCVEVTAGATQNGAGIQQAACNGQPKQLWKLRNKSGNVYEIVNAPSNRCLDVTGGPTATADGALTELWDCTGSPNQAWALTAPQSAPKPVVAKHSSKCLDVVGGPTATQDGALLEQWTCTGALNQQWSFKDMGTGRFEIVAQHSGKCIEAAGGGTSNGTSIQQMTCTGVPGQLWMRQNAGTAGEYKLVHVPSNRCLDVTGGPTATANGALLELWDCTGEPNQTWTIGAPGIPATRDPLKWPFAQNSIWNMPIGSGAVYVHANLPAIPDDPTDNVDAIWTPIPNIDSERIVLRPSAPMTQIQYSDAGWTPNTDRCIAKGGTVAGLPVTVPIPADYVVPDSPKNEGAVFLMPDRRTLIQTQPFARCSPGGVATSMIRILDNGADADLYGDGRLGAHGGSKLSTLGGTIRLGELRPGQQGMRHALKINLFEKMAYYNCPDNDKTQCFRWPAFVADNKATINYGSINNNQNAAMKMGALLALPPSVNINSLGLESDPGRQIAWTLQNYGGYIVDSAGGPSFTLSAEEGADGSKVEEFQRDFGYGMVARVRDNTPWTRDLQRILPHLHVVNNNSPSSIGGGGTPRQPLAPPFQ